MDHQVSSKDEKHLGIQGSGSLETGELNAAHSPLPWKLHEGLIFCTMRPKYGYMDEQPAVAACTKEAAKDAAFVEERYEVDDPAEMCRANAELIVRSVNAHDLFVSAAKATLKYVDNLDENTPVDSKCKECIQATVYYPKGTEPPPLCWIHQLEKALALANGQATVSLEGENKDL